MKKNEKIITQLQDKGLVILPPSDVIKNLKKLKKDNIIADVIVFDPWYFKEKEDKFSGVASYKVSFYKKETKKEYKKFIKKILTHGSEVSKHIFLWGFPEVAADFVNLAPQNWFLKAWLTWFYKNNQKPSDAWKPSQNACLHFAKKGSRFYKENFKKSEPYDVIEADLVGPKVGYRYQGEKNIEVYEKLILMSTPENGLVIDFMCGAGTCAEAALKLGRRVIISDISEEAILLCEERLLTERIKI